MSAPHRLVLPGVVAELDAMTHRLAQIRGQLADLDHTLAGEPVPPAPEPVPVMPMPVPVPTMPPPVVAHDRPQRDSSWVGKLLAVAGVAVTLIGVVLLLALAAQAGLLRPEVRVLGGAALGAALVGAAVWWQSRPGGRTGAIALAATGIAAGYLDVLAVTGIYDWVPAAVGLVLASLVAAGGLVLARLWDSEHLGVLIVAPLIVLAPALTDSVDLLLIGFMLTLSGAVLPVQLGKDWGWMHGVRIAAPTLPLLVALAAHSGTGPAAWPLAACCAIAAVLAIGSGLALVPGSRRPTTLAVLSALGTVPILAAGIAVGHLVAALLAAGLGAAMLAVVGLGTGLPAPVRQVFAALAALSTLIAVTVGFDGLVAVPVLLGLGIVVAVGARQDVSARWAACGFGAVGTLGLLTVAPPGVLTQPTPLPTAEAVCVLVSSLLLIGWVVTLGWALRWASRQTTDGARALAVCGAATVVYAVTVFTVTTGVGAFGTGGGFLGGHVAATLCWLAIAAGLFGYALRASSRQVRDTTVGAGLTLTGGAMAKLFLFDLGTLDGMFRVAVFLVAGLVLLGTGAGYARSLARQDRPRP